MKVAGNKSPITLLSIKIMFHLGRLDTRPETDITWINLYVTDTVVVVQVDWDRIPMIRYPQVFLPASYEYRTPYSTNTTVV